MPFTFSHPAAVLPLSYLPKRWTSMTGLIVGSLAPDFDYFIRMRIYSPYSHSWTGMFWFDLPLSIVLAFIFHQIIRDSLIDNLPKFLTARLLSYKKINWPKYFQKNFKVVIASILVGVSTHILWDNFTHEHGHFVQGISYLQNTLKTPGHAFPTYWILQHVSSLVGALIIVFVLLLLPADRTYERNKSIFPFWILVVFIALAVVAERILSGADFSQVGNLIVTAISGGLIGLMFTGIIFLVFSKTPFRTAQ